MRLFTLLWIIFLSWNCSQQPYLIPLEIPRDGLYDSAYPHTDVSVQLNRLSQSVLKIYFTAYYKNYFFTEESNIDNNTFRQAIIDDQFVNQISFSKSSFGTATIIANDQRKIVILSCAHIGSFPDTIRTYFEKKSLNDPSIIESVAIKTHSTHFVEHDFLKGDLELLAADKSKDLALFGISHSSDSPFSIPPFPYPFGESENLTWGSLVYMMGYPIGHKMVTQGMVSPSEKGDKHTFMVDALFNKGFSGGVVLAVKDGVPNFELVGLGKSISAQTEFFLTPDSKNVLNYSNSFIPYEGDVYVTPQRTLHYGVTYCVTIDAIKDFIDENRSEVRALGYPLPTLK